MTTQDQEITNFTTRLTSTVHEKKMAIMHSKEEFPFELRATIEENNRDEPDIFLSKMEGAIQFYIVCILYNIPTRHPDTIKELEVAIRFFPNILSSRKENGMYPIACLLKRYAGEYNLKTVRFIPMFAMLGIEFGQFRKRMRGGLIYSRNIGGNMLKELATVYDQTKSNDDVGQNKMDEAFLTVLKELRRLGLFQKEDIVRYDLIGEMIRQDVFPTRRFRYLVDWDPPALERVLESSNARLPTANTNAIQACIDARRMLRKKSTALRRPPVTTTKKYMSFAKLKAFLMK